MRVIKRGQLAMLSISFMVMIAGYINYKYDPAREENLGQTMKVNSDEVYLYAANTDNVNVYNEHTSTSSKNDTIYNTKKEDTIATFKASRDNMFSELESTYNSAIQSISATSDDVKMYQEKLDGLVNKKHLINIVEGIIKAKGIENIVILPTGDNYNVVVRLKEKLTPAQVAMIEQIIKDELKTDAKNIAIIEE